MGHTLPINTPELVALFRQGDRDAYAKLFQIHHPATYTFALRLLKSPTLAEDFVHEAFIKLWERRELLDPEQNIGAYLLVTCKHLAFNYLKKAARDRQLVKEILLHMPTGANTTESDYLLGEYTHMADAALSKLPPRRREAYTLCKIEGKTYDEAAKTMGTTRDAVKDHMKKAIRFMRTYFELHAGALTIGGLLMHIWLF
jgi:RNA polymerase sigma-70 factor (ECF subfamily)